MADRQESKLKNQVWRGQELGSRENPVAGSGTLGFAAGFRVTLRERPSVPSAWLCGAIPAPVTREGSLTLMWVLRVSAGSWLLRSREGPETRLEAGLGVPWRVGIRDR